MELNLSSDALRLALIYKHGGWYADIDTVIMKPLSKLVESHPGGTFYISSDQKNKFLIEVRILRLFSMLSTCYVTDENIDFFSVPTLKE